MKIILLFGCLLSACTVTGQTDRAAMHKRAKDSAMVVLQNQLGINKQKADELLIIIDASVENMNNVAKDYSKNKNEKLAQFRQLAAERDRKIAALLSAAQIQQLQTIMQANKQRVRARSSN